MKACIRIRGKSWAKFLSLAFILCAIGSCQKELSDTTKDAVPSTEIGDSTGYNNDWTFASHGSAAADYSIVFPQDRVERLDITMTLAQWNAIRANMQALFGYDFGARVNGRGGFPDNETDYIDVTLKFANKTWRNVGFRLKGNSSLAQAWGSGNFKLPLKLNFDKFEDEYPAITDQHFYGFKELSFSPSFRDQSLLREKVTADIFRLAGIPAAQTAFYQVHIDFGAGPEYCGVYTAVEVPEDEMIKQQFGEKKGNIYKPESRLNTFIASEFDKKNNEDAADFSDVQAFIAALNSTLRTTNVAQWRQNLEAVFNMDHYLRYLAVNNTIVNWDSYGSMAHNYYLYNHSSRHLTWIPWDHNEALSGSPGITGTNNGGGGMNRNGVSLSMNEVSGLWPLLRYVADDEVYLNRYKRYLQEFVDNVFIEEKMYPLLDTYHTLIKPYAEKEQKNYSYLNSITAFTTALNDLKTHVKNRLSLVLSYVQ